MNVLNVTQTKKNNIFCKTSQYPYALEKKMRFILSFNYICLYKMITKIKTN